MISLPTPATTRQITQRTVMQIVLDRRGVSRAELARLTGLSKQTMSEVFRELENGGWVRPSGRTSGSVGRSAATYEICADRAVVFGADVGGTKVQAALADMQGSILAEMIEPTDPAGGEEVVRQLARMSASLRERANVPPDRLLVGTIGIPGAFDARSGRLFMVPNIAGLEGAPLVDMLEEQVSFQVHVGNDVNMAAKGEQWMGEGRSVDNFVFIALGTGIGMGIISERRIMSGARGAAGEIATLPIGADPYDSRTFHSGALESSIGSAAIRDRYRGGGGLSQLTVRDMIDRIGQGDAIAATTLDAVARTLAQAILSVSAVLDPDLVILGGSIGARTELLERIERFLPMCMPNPPRCTTSNLGSRAGLLGTVGHSLDMLRKTLFQTPHLDLSGVQARSGEVSP